MEARKKRELDDDAPLALKARRQTLPASILIVDDEPLIRATLSEFLMQEGFEVRTCANGEEALAEAAGAVITRLDRFYGHLLSRDAMDNPGLWPYPQIDAVATAAIVVDAAGKRLLDEGLGGISITNDLARLEDPLCATVICDAPIWETAGIAAQIPPNPQLLAGGGRLHQADTLADLAHAAGLSPAGLAETVDVVEDRLGHPLAPQLAVVGVGEAVKSFQAAGVGVAICRLRTGRRGVARERQRRSWSSTVRPRSRGRAAYTVCPPGGR